MIYLIITTSINNRFGPYNTNERQERYLFAITKTLGILPDTITPIIVENNGKRNTYLDNFIHNSRPVDVFYTDNNKYNFKSKGINEMLDIKDAINRYNMNDDDIIIKLTGRYFPLSNIWFDTVLTEQGNYDALIKFFGTCSLQFEEYDCILGCYSMRVKYLKLFNHISIHNYASAEIAFARYARFCGARIKEIKNLDIECCFGEDLRTLIV